MTFEGALVPGTTTATTTIGTFPAGFRPLNAITLALPANAYCTVTVSTAGVLKTANAATGNYNMDGVSFRAKGRANYDPGY